MCSVHSLFIKLLQKLRAALISQMPYGRSLGDASVITLRSRIYIKVTRMNIRGATMGSIGGYVFTTNLYVPLHDQCTYMYIGIVSIDNCGNNM